MQSIRVFVGGFRKIRGLRLERWRSRLTLFLFALLVRNSDVASAAYQYSFEQNPE